jgi:hypothetical protein
MLMAWDSLRYCTAPAHVQRQNKMAPVMCLVFFSPGSCNYIQRHVRSIRYRAWKQNMSVSMSMSRQITDANQADWDKCRVMSLCFFITYHKFLYTTGPPLCQENVKLGVGAKLGTWLFHLTALYQLFQKERRLTLLVTSCVGNALSNTLLKER